MAHLLKVRRLNQSSFSDILGIRPQVIQTYLSGRSKPPLAELDDWCEHLQLNKMESQQMRWLALEAYTPTAVWMKLEQLTAEMAQASEEKIGLQAKILHLTGQITDLRGKLAKLSEMVARLPEQEIKSP